MPVLNIHASEFCEMTMQLLRETSAEIIRLSDVIRTPLAAGETPDSRRHLIAKLGKRMAEGFLALDKVIGKIATELANAADVTAGPVNPPPDSSEVN